MTFDSDTVLSNIRSKTFKELLKLRNFLKLDSFSIAYVPEVFDLNEFYVYMKKNKRTKISMEFEQLISETYKKRLEAIVDEINATKDRDY